MTAWSDYNRKRMEEERSRRLGLNGVLPVLGTSVDTRAFAEGLAARTKQKQKADQASAAAAANERRFAPFMPPRRDDYAPRRNSGSTNVAPALNGEYNGQPYVRIQPKSRSNARRILIFLVCAALIGVFFLAFRGRLVGALESILADPPVQMASVSPPPAASPGAATPAKPTPNGTLTFTQAQLDAAENKSSDADSLPQAVPQVSVAVTIPTWPVEGLSFQADRHGAENGCKGGVLVLYSSEMDFTCATDARKSVKVSQAEVLSVDKDGINTAIGKFHFSIAGKNKDEVHALFVEWKAQPAKPAALFQPH